MKDGLIVAHVVSSLEASAGGPPVVAANLARAQMSIGARARLVCFASRPNAEEVPLEPIPGDGRSVPAHRLARPQASQGFMLFFPPLELRSVLSDANVVHLHGFWDPLIAAASKVSHSLGKPVVLAPHGMLTGWSLAQKRLKKFLAYHLLYRRVLEGANCCHALTEEEGSAIHKLCPRAQVEALPNGVNMTDGPTPPRDALRSVHESLCNQSYFLYLGRLHSGKGVDILLQALAQLRSMNVKPSPVLVIAGPDFGAQASIEAEIHRLGLGQYAILTGPLWGVEKDAALRHAAAFCLASEHEAFSMAVLEAAQAGAPLLISEGCNFGAVASSGAGFVLPRTAEAFAHAMRRVLEAPEDAKHMGAAAREMVGQHYTWRRIAQRALDIYDSLLKDGHARKADDAPASSESAPTFAAPETP